MVVGMDKLGRKRSSRSRWRTWNAFVASSMATISDLLDLGDTPYNRTSDTHPDIEREPETRRKTGENSSG